MIETEKAFAAIQRSMAEIAHAMLYLPDAQPDMSERTRGNLRQVQAALHDARRAADNALSIVRRMHTQRKETRI